MRVPPPGSLKLNRVELLQDVARQLEAHHPELRDVLGDPTDPGWLLIEQVAWMVEQLSEQLDQHPRHAIQHLLNLMGYALQPALPALGVVTLETPLTGHLQTFSTDHHPLRFMATASERHSLLEFVPLELEGIPVVPARVEGIVGILERGELVDRLPPREPIFPDTHVAWTGAAAPLEAFQLEDIHFSFPLALRDRLAAIIQRYNADIKGWMTLAFDGRETPHEVGVRWRVGMASLEGEFLESEETGVQSITFPWRELSFHQLQDDAQSFQEFRPAIRLRPELLASGARLVIASNGTLRVELERGGQWLREQRLSDLLSFIRPIPAGVAERFYQTLLVTATDWDERTAPPRSGERTPIFRRLLPEATRRVPWLAAALQDPRWDSLFDGTPANVVYIRFNDRLPPGQRVRFGVLLSWHNGLGAVPPPQVYSLFFTPSGRPMLFEGGTVQDEAVTEQWRFTWPARDMASASGGTPRPGRPAPRTLEPLELFVYEVTLPATAYADGMLVVVPGAPPGLQAPNPGAALELKAVWLNPVLIANTPQVHDGRMVTLASSQHETVSLLAKDLISRPLLEAFAHHLVPVSTLERLRTLPLAQAHLRRQEKTVLDWKGLTVDCPEGLLVLNGVDADSRELGMRRGDHVDLSWYRRTDGARGNVPEGSISVVEQSSLAPLPVRRVFNPLPTVFGRNREEVDQGIARMFSPPSATLPATAADFESWAALELSDLPQPWVIRCWGYAERTLLASDWWLGSDADAKGVEEAAATLDRAGSRGLLMVVGSVTTPGTGPEFHRARLRLTRAWERLAGRLPTLDTLVVAPFVPLIHETRSGKVLRATPESPRFELKDLDGWLFAGRRVRPVPAHLWFYLNAGIVASRSV